MDTDGEQRHQSDVGEEEPLAHSQPRYDGDDNDSNDGAAFLSADAVEIDTELEEDGADGEDGDDDDDLATLKDFAVDDAHEVRISSRTIRY